MKRFLPHLRIPASWLWSTLMFVLVSLTALAQRPFVTTWQTTAAAESITIPANPEVTGYHYTVDWGDGTIAADQTGDANHTYAAPGTYTVSISGNFPAIRLQSVGNEVSDKLMSIEQWGDIAWQSMEGAFSGARNMVLNATDVPDLSGASSLSRMFDGAEALNGDLSGWDVSGITDMSLMFNGAAAFNGDISNWDVSNVTNMYGMFWYAGDFNRDIGGWTVSQVENMGYMFYSAADFNQDLSGWTVPNVENMEGMFSFTLGFDQSLGSWDISSVTDMDDMFLSTGLSPENYSATLIGWAPRSVQSGVTLDAPSLTYCPGTEAANARQLLETNGWTINDAGVAADCDGGGVVVPADPNHFITTWKTDNTGPSAPNQIIIPATGGFTYAWVDVNNAASTGSGSGNDATTITFPQAGTYQISIQPTGSTPFHQIRFHELVDDDKHKIISVNNWGAIPWGRFQFNGCSNLKITATDIPDLSGVTNLSWGFSKSGIESIPNINEWDVSHVTDLNSFLQDVTAFNQSLSDWDVSNVTNMAFMFDGASSFNQPLDSWDVGNLKYFDYLFRDAASFNQSLGAWNLESFAGAVGVFFNSGMSCENYSYTLYGWATNPNTNADAMFHPWAPMEYSPDVVPYRDFLIDDLGWDITGDALGTCSITLPSTPVTPDNNTLYVDINVDTDATGYTGAGNSWGNAIPQLADALKWAREQDEGGSPDWTETEPLRIFVAKGTYKPLYSAIDGEYTVDGDRYNSFVLVPNVQLYGGFDPSSGIETLEHTRILPDQRGSMAGTTILDGDLQGNDASGIPIRELHSHSSRLDNAHHVVVSAGDVGVALINGFTITNGNAEGAPIGPVVTVYSNAIYNGDNGGGLITNYSSPQVSHILFVGNSATETGGAVDTYRSTAPQFDHVIITGNWAVYSGGGLSTIESNAVIKNALITGNESFRGGGILLTGSSSLSNVTVFGNKANEITGGVYFGESSGTVSNSIIWGNSIDGDMDVATASIAAYAQHGSIPTITNSLIANLGGSANWNFEGVNDGGNNIDVDPDFISTVMGNDDFLRLSDCSPAINVGSNQAYTDAGGNPAADLDLAGNPRVYKQAGGGVIDMGAYEYQGERVFVQSLTMPDAVQVAYGTAWDDIDGLPMAVTAGLSDDTEVSIPLDGNHANWTLVTPAGSSYDGDVAGSYVFAVPLLIPAEVCYLNPEELQAQITVTVAKGTPVLAISWDGEAVDATEGLSLTYGDAGELVFGTTDPDGVVSYAFGDGNTPVLDLAYLSAVAAQQAGTATLTIEQEETDNYEAASVALAVTVASKAVTIVAGAGQGKVYGADEPTAYDYELAEGDALAFDDELTDIVSAASREAGEGVGTYDMELAFDADKADNYAITFQTDNNAFAITPLEITVTAENQTKVFGSDDPALTYAFTPELIGDDVFAGSIEREEGDDAGSYSITQGDLSLGDNYEITFEEGTMTITPAAYEGVAFNDGSFEYDGIEHVLDLSGELPEEVAVTYEIDGEANNGATDVGTYEVKALIDGGNNYEDAELTARLTITPLEITVVADDKTKVFGADDPVLTYTFTPELVGDDAFTGRLDRGAGEDVGDYAITQGNLSLSDNYEIIFEAGTLTIAPAEINGITFNNSSSTYDGTEHRLSLAGNLPAGASVTYTIDGAAGNGATDAGTREVKAHIDGGVNYEDVELTATLTIISLEITVTADDQSKTFGTGDPVLTYTFTPALIAGDAFTGSLDREEGESTDTYAITQGDLSLGTNYTVAFEAGTLTITSASVTGIAFENTSFTYDGTEHRLSLAGDLPVGASVTYENNGRIDAGSQTVQAVIDGNGRYEDEVLEATLTVLPATRTLDFPVLPEKTYGDMAFDAGAAASSGEPIGYTSSNTDVVEVSAEGEITIIGAGETTITATVPENANYSNRPQVSRILTVSKASQAITLTSPAEVDRDAGSIALTASSTSGLPVTLTADNAEVATLEGAELNILRLGRVNITATQNGDANHEAAEPITLTIRVVDATSDLPVRVHPVISPNGDGINEFLMIEAVTDYPENRVTIFNRNGTLLWEASGYDNNRVAFRGISTGQQLLPAGTYFYIVEVKDGNTWKHKKGWFVLRY